MSETEKLNKTQSVISENKEYPNWAHLLLSCYISAHNCQLIFTHISAQNTQ